MWIWPSKWGQMCRGNELWEVVGYLDISRNRNRQLASRRIIKDFTVDTLTISAGGLFQKGTALTLNACWCRGFDISVGGADRHGC